MARRFKPAERDAFTVGTAIEWRNVSHWHPGTIVSEPEQDTFGDWYVGVENHATTRTVSKGQYVRGYPKSVRLPADK
jgi:hypothetical protein